MSDSPAKPAVSASSWSDAAPLVKKRFTGPADGVATLRTDFTKAAWADVMQHARESLDAEVCGVLVGQVCTDDAGRWVEVTAVIRGHAAASGQTHVTFTHETWERIHSERESRFPRLAIVGWYHTHPGFGVEFSEMDAFIHSNFFAGAAQLALVADPVAGREAICINGTAGITYLERCWVDARERLLSSPAAATAVASGGVGQARIDALEARVGQLVGTLDDLRNRIWSYYLTVGLAVVLSTMLYIGWQVWMSWRTQYDPPKIVNEISVPVRIGDQTVMLMARVYGWKVPDEVNVLLQEQLRLQVEMAAKLVKEAQDAQDAKNANDANGAKGTKDTKDAAPSTESPPVKP